MRASAVVLSGSPAEYVRVASDRERWQTPRGEFELWSPRADVLVARLVGRGSEQFVELYVSRFRALMGRGLRASVFFDFERAESYEPRARLEVMKFALEVRGTAKVTHFLLGGSPVVTMTLALLNRALGSILHLHSSRPAFEAALDEALASSEASAH